MNSVQDIANYFLSKNNEEMGDVITHLKLQKLVYYAQAFHLAIFNKPLFAEDIEAWDHGPVVPKLYHEYKNFKNNPIPCPLSEAEVLALFTSEQLDLLENVHTVYGQFSAWKLRDLTHSEPTWNDAYPDEVISHEAMKEYFLTQVAD